MYLLLCISIAYGVTLYDGKHVLQVSTCHKSSMTMGAGGEQQIPACDQGVQTDEHSMHRHPAAAAPSQAHTSGQVSRHGLDRLC